MSFFGGVDLAIPFLLEVMGIPVDLYQLYLVTGVVTGRFATLLGVMNLVTFTLVATCAVTGLVKLNTGRLVSVGIASVAVCVVALVATGVILEHTVKNEYTKDRVIARMQLLREPITAMIHERVPETPPAPSEATSTLDRVRDRGVLRVGYIENQLPFAYVNTTGELVGFEVEMANHLARDLEVELDFIPLTLETMADLLAEDKVDIVMAGLIATPSLVAQVAMSESYLQATLALVVKQDRAKMFKDLDALHRLPPTKIAVPRDYRYLEPLVQQVMPNAMLVPVGSPGEFFDLNFQGAEALLINAEAGSAWTLLNPSFEVVVPKPNPRKLPVGYALPKGDIETINFLDRWIEFKTLDGTIRKAYRYWILGEGAERREARWSIMRNVLGWGNVNESGD